MVAKSAGEEEGGGAKRQGFPRIRDNKQYTYIGTDTHTQTVLMAQAKQKAEICI